ncbi:MAG: polyprenyl diphosphate synthase [Spirochaetia bacterium]
MERDKAPPIDPSSVPAHIGIIMDGNGRWAEEKKKPRAFGHKNGIDAAKRIIKAAAGLGVSYITLYTFSTENWRRPKREVDFLMRMLGHHMRNDTAFYHENHIKLRHAGNLNGLPADIRQEILKSIEATKEYSAVTAVLAINYGGRDEIVRAFSKWLEQSGDKDTHDADRSRAAQLPSARTGPSIEELSRFMDNPDIPDPDLVIRTAGEMRLSNFLLWESAYAEFYYSPKLWPDWAEEDLKEAVSQYQQRKRKFGGRV